MFAIVTLLTGTWGKTVVSLNLHFFDYIGTIQYYQLNLV